MGSSGYTSLCRAASPADKLESLLSAPGGSRGVFLWVCWFDSNGVRHGRNVLVKGAKLLQFGYDVSRSIVNPIELVVTLQGFSPKDPSDLDWMLG